MRPLNSRADLELLRGSAAFEDALRNIYGSMTGWSLVDGEWQATEDLSVLDRLDFTKAAFLTEISPFAFPAPTAPALPPPEPEPEPPPTLEEAIAAKLAELDDFRWRQEIGGASFGGVNIRTDWNSQAKVTAAWAMAKLDPSYTIPTWEVVPGVFMPLDNATIIAMGEAVRDHVQDTFNRKAVLHGQIAALESVDAVAAFDIAAEW